MYGKIIEQIVFGIIHLNILQWDCFIIHNSSYLKDILQWDFMDTYNNLTIKSILALKWASTFCSNAKFVIKMDDDVFLNSVNLANFLESRSSQFEIAGHHHDLDSRTVER